MANTTILIVDNRKDILETRSNLLRDAGYEVIESYTPQEAKKQFESQKIDLAIIDIRLVEDEDKSDESGLMLADMLPRQIPKIILTDFPSYSLIRIILGKQSTWNYTNISSKYNSDTLLAEVEEPMENSKNFENNAIEIAKKAKDYLGKSPDELDKLFYQELKETGQWKKLKDKQLWRRIKKDVSEVVQISQRDEIETTLRKVA